MINDTTESSCVMYLNEKGSYVKVTLTDESLCLSFRVVKRVTGTTHVVPVYECHYSPIGYDLSKV